MNATQIFFVAAMMLPLRALAQVEMTIDPMEKKIHVAEPVHLTVKVRNKSTDSVTGRFLLDGRNEYFKKEAPVGATADTFPTIPGDTTTWTDDPSGALFQKTHAVGNRIPSLSENCSVGSATWDRFRCRKFQVVCPLENS